MAEETRASEFDEFWVSHKTWILIQALRETSLPYPWEGPRVETPRPAEDWSDADVEALVEAITGRAMPRPIRAEKQDIVSLQVREAVRAIGRWRAIHWDPAKHPRGAIPQNRGWFSPTRGAAAPSARGVNATYRPKVMQTALRMSRNKRTATVNPLSLPPPPPSATGANIGASAGSTFNSEGVETAGTGPEVTDSFRAKVQLALELLDPDIARWWKATSVGGQLRARDAGWTGKKQHSWIESEAPLVEVDKSYTAGQTAQAIIDQVNSGLFANSIGAYYRTDKIGRTGSPEELQKWRAEAGADAASQATVLAELYLNSLATLTPAGDLVVSTDDLIQNGPHARQLMSLLPFVGSLAVVGVIFKAGKRSAKVTRSVANKLGKLTEAVRKKILQLAAKAKNDAEAADIIRREVEAVVGTGQTHHAISSPVHQALERHPILKGKYKYRDSRFEAFAKDLPSHEGYPEWHRKLDAEVSAWIDRNKHATEEGFERFLQERYDKEDLRKLFPRGLEGGAP